MCSNNMAESRDFPEVKKCKKTVGPRGGMQRGGWWNVRVGRSVGAHGGSSRGGAPAWSAIRATVGRGAGRVGESAARLTRGCEVEHYVSTRGCGNAFIRCAADVQWGTVKRRNSHEFSGQATVTIILLCMTLCRCYLVRMNSPATNRSLRKLHIHAQS